MSYRRDRYRARIDSVIAGGSEASDSAPALGFVSVGVSEMRTDELGQLCRNSPLLSSSEAVSTHKRFESREHPALGDSASPQHKIRMDKAAGHLSLSVFAHRARSGLKVSTQKSKLQQGTKC